MDRRIVKTRDAIQKALFSMIRDCSVKRITISEIARRANIDRKTFYLHYSSVEDIMNAYSQRKIEELMNILQEAKFFETEFDINIFFHALNTIIEPDIEIYRALVGNSEYEYFWDQIQRKIVAAIKDMYGKSMKFSLEQLDICMSFYVAGFVSTYVKWLRQEYQISLEELSQLTTELAYFGAQKLLAEDNKEQIADILV